MHRGKTAVHTRIICSRTIVSEVLKLKSTYFNFIIDGLANYPSNVKDITRFLYYSLCLMKSSQRTLYLVASQGCSLKADAKVRLFSETQNFSEEKFKNMQEIYFTLDKYQSYTIIIPYLLLRARERNDPLLLPHYNQRKS